MNASLKGTVGVYHFSEMVRDTIAAHGWAWAYGYYVVGNDVPEWQFMLFAGAESVWLVNQGE